jgi:hypothetical protein
MPSNCYFRGDALAVLDTKTLVVGGTYADGQTYSATMNGKTLSYTSISGDTNDTVTASLLAILTNNAATPPEFQEAGYAVNDAFPDTIVMTAGNAGIPLDITTGATGTGTFVTTTTQPATGPSFWDEPANWSTGTVPVTGDSVYIRNSNTNILYGINQSGVTLALMDVDASHTGKIGNPDNNPLGYAEYRDTFLSLGVTTAFVGRGYGTGPGRFRWNAGSVQTTLGMYSTGTPDDGIVAAIDFVGTHASNVLNAQKGTFAVGLKPGVASTILTMNVGSKDNQNSDVTIYSGYNVTFGTLNMAGGSVDIWNGLTTANITAGTLNCNKGAFGTINNEGTVNYDTAGTLGTYVGGTNSSIDCSRIVAARAITTATLEANSSFNDPAKTVTFGGSGVFIRCQISELKLFNRGEQMYLQFA